MNAVKGYTFLCVPPRIALSNFATPSLSLGGKVMAGSGS